MRDRVHAKVRGESDGYSFGLDPVVHRPLRPYGQQSSVVLQKAALAFADEGGSRQAFDILRRAARRFAKSRGLPEVEPRQALAFAAKAYAEASGAGEYRKAYELLRTAAVAYVAALSAIQR